MVAVIIVDNRGGVYYMTHRMSVLAVMLLCMIAPFTRGWTCDALVNERDDCGWTGMSQLECAARECCWEPSDRTPWCFKPIQRCAYVASKKKKSDSFLLEKKCVGSHQRDINAIQNLRMTVEYLKYGVVHVRIKPIDVSEITNIDQYYPKRKRSKKRKAKVIVDKDPFTFQIWRRSDGLLLFDMDDLVFQEYYLSITTRLYANSTLHGLGYRAGPLTLKHGRYAIFSRDASTLPENGNLYSAQPMYINVYNNRVHGVFFLNTHAMEADYSDNRLQMRMLGGHLDMFVFPGPTIERVHKQYLSVIGTPPPLDPRFLGLQQSRYGYRTLDDVKQMVLNYERHRLPLDVVWLDIEYNFLLLIVSHLWEWNDFVVDNERYPHNETRQFIDELHKKNIAVVPIVDPAIKIDSRLPAYNLGIKYDVFMKSDDGRPYVGRVWPGQVHFIDFLQANASKYLLKLLREYQKVVPFDGLWLDMNEPSNFDSGMVFMPERGYFSLNYPKYEINNGDRRLSLPFQTVPMDVRHGDGQLMYATHNIYGMTEAVLMRKILDNIRPQTRPFLLTRSVFPGSAQYTSTWLGDNHSTFSQLRESIRGVLKYAMFSGMAMSGPDLCGFNGDTDDELCARWMAVGAFFPFSRNHNSIDSRVDQEPYRFKWTAAATRRNYAIKYALLPYWITLFERHRRLSEMVIRPFDLHDDNLQFYVGRDLLVCPVAFRNMTAINCRLPLTNRWYDYNTNNMMARTQNTTIQAPLDTIPVFIRGGSILFKHTPLPTTLHTLHTNYTAHAYLSDDHTATGYLYVDDNTSKNVGNRYNQVVMTVRVEGGGGGVRVSVEGYFGWRSEKFVESICVYGVDRVCYSKGVFSIDRPFSVLL